MIRLRQAWQRLFMILTMSVFASALGQRSAGAQDLDDQTFERARIDNSSLAYQEYLDQFPTGRHAAEAFAGIVLHARGIGIGGLGSIEPAAGGTAPAAPTLY